MSDYQLGTKNESTYGTRITVDTFHEILPGDPIAVKMGTIESQGLRPRRQVPFADRFQRYAMGAEGTRSLEVLTLGFEWWLQHMLGAVDLNADTPVSGVDQHVATLANLCGLSFTWQENVVMGACKNTDQAFTYGGGKISSWTLSGEVEGAVTLEVEVLFANYTKATALATASYADGCRGRTPQQRSPAQPSRSTAGPCRATTTSRTTGTTSTDPELRRARPALSRCRTVTVR